MTMQLARLPYRLNTKTPAGKLRQIGAAAVAGSALLQA